MYKSLKLALILFCCVHPIWADSRPESVGLRQKSFDTLPAFSFQGIDGHHYSSSQWKGKVLVINFWASWCRPCLKEIPELISLEQQYSSKGLMVVGIAIDEIPQVSRFVDYYSINYLVLVEQDKGYILAKRLGNRSGSIPFTAIVDSAGHLRYVHEGSVDRDTLADIVLDLL